MLILVPQLNKNRVRLDKVSYLKQHYVEMYTYASPEHNTTVMNTTSDHQNDYEAVNLMKKS